MPTLTNWNGLLWAFTDVLAVLVGINWVPLPRLLSVEEDLGAGDRLAKGVYCLPSCPELACQLCDRDRRAFGGDDGLASSS